MNLPALSRQLSFMQTRSPATSSSRQGSCATFRFIFGLRDSPSGERCTGKEKRPQSKSPTCDSSAKEIPSRPPIPQGQKASRECDPGERDLLLKWYSTVKGASSRMGLRKNRSAMESAGNRPSRRSVRLPGFDYSKVGMYFLTICAAERRSIFGEI